MARSKKQLRRQTAAKPPWPDAEVDESPFARVTADMVTRGQFNLASPKTDEELQRNRFLASTAGLLVFKGDAAPSPIGVASEGSALAEAIAAHVLAEEEIRRLRDELASLKSSRSSEGDDGDVQIRNLRALEEMRTQAEAARAEADAQVRSLRDELVALRSTLAEREDGLAQMAADHERARTRWEDESKDSLSNTEQERKDAEAARLAEAEAKWREQAQKTLRELHAQAEAAHDQAERDVKALRDEVAALRLSLRDREAVLAQATSDHDQAHTHWQQESYAALSNAEKTWKVAETARLADAEAKWREHSTQALAALRAEADKARESAEETIQSLQDQMSAIQATLAEREAALAEAARDTQRVRDHARQELDGVLAKTKTWQAEEAQRLAAAEAKWKQQSSAALAEAQARYQAAEGALVNMRLEADRARSNATGGSINPPKSGVDRSVFGTKAAREPEPAAIRLPTREARGQAKQEQIVLQPHRVLEDPHPRKRRGMARDMILVAALVIVAIVAYPRIEPLIPEPWRSNIAALTGGFGSASVAAKGSAVVARDVNLRVGPSTTANIISTLPQGLNVATLATRDEWTFVEVGADGRNPRVRRGWVFSSFLNDGAADGEDDEAAQSEDSE